MMASNAYSATSLSNLNWVDSFITINIGGFSDCYMPMK